MGHLFHGRFKGVLVEQDAYLWALARYVVVNPVRAGMVRHVSAWAWSSRSAMVGRGWADWLLEQFGKQGSRDQTRYAAFLEEEVGLPSKGAVWHQVLLGTDDVFGRDCVR